MKTIVAVNTVPYGSTASIMVGINTIANPNEYTFHLFTGYSYHPMKTPDGISFNRIGGKFARLSHVLLSRLTGYEATYSKLATHQFIKKLKKIKPDVIHIHNLHDWYINIKPLFKYIKENNVRLIWTFHDCWPFTGYCPHFEVDNCYKWQTKCEKCPSYKHYPKSLFDKSAKMYQLKKKLFLGVNDLTIVTPSKWLANLVKQSYLKDYPVKVINNGIDLSTFKPTKSDFRKKYNLEDKFILLGVSFDWNYRKGLDIFIKLANELDDKFKIVLVGTNDKVDELLPKSILSIHRTQNQQELVEIYSEADIFVNPTREENFPTVNIESLACGTPIVSFETGGSPEIFDESCGVSVKKDDYESLKNTIVKLRDKNFSTDACLKRSKEFNRNDLLKKYFNLYE